MKLSIAFLFLFIANTVSGQHARFSPDATNIKTGSCLEFIGTGDLNGDGLTDIAGATTSYFDTANDRKIFIWLQGVNGQLLPAIDYRYNEGNLRAGCLAVYDLNLDGKAEIVMGFGDSVAVYSLIAGNLQKQYLLQTFPMGHPDGVTVGDFDGDNKMDIGICHWYVPYITILYGKSNLTTWDRVDYQIANAGYDQVITARFGSPGTEFPVYDALVYLRGQGSNRGIEVMHFDNNRSLQKTSSLRIPAKYGNGTAAPYGVAAVKPGHGRPLELWATSPGNNSRIAIWRGLQQQPDSIFEANDIAEAIQAANLDCDDGDEVVVAHNYTGKNVSVFSDSLKIYTDYMMGHLSPQGLSLDDINNDGRKDICVAADLKGLVIFYNVTTPCWPADIEKQEIKNDARIVPNPTNSQSKIVLPYSIQSGSVTIVNAVGQVVYKQEIRNNDVLLLEKSGLSSGMYFYQILDAVNGKGFSGRFVYE